MGLQAFNAQGNTVTFTAATVAPTAVQALSATLGANQYRIINTGNVTVFVAAGINAAAANINGGSLVTPSGNGAASIPIPANSVAVLSFAPNYFFTGQTVSGTAVIYLTPGDGR